MNLESLKDQLKKLNDFNSERSQKISNWKETIIPSISSYLKKVADLDDNLQFQMNDSILNNETLMLQFTKRPSGYKYNSEDLLNKSEGKSGHIFMDGGYLAVSLMYSGKIAAWMVKPEIKDFIKNDEDVVRLDVIEQDDCTLEWLSQKTNTFFDNIFNWRTQEVNRIPISF